MENIGPDPTLQDAVKPHRATISIAVAIGMTIGVIPYLVFIQHINWVAAYSVAALVIAFFSLRSFEAIATEHPSALEIVLGGWNAILAGSTVSVLSLLFFLIGYWVWRGLSGLLEVFDWAIVSSPQAWGFWCSLVASGLFGFVLVISTAKEIARKLYPPIAGTRSPYLGLIMEVRTLRLLALASVAAVAAPFLFFELGGWPFSTVLTLALFYPSLAIENHERQTAKPQKARVVEAMAKLLNHAGFLTTVSPRTGRADVDPFVKTVDLLAQSAERNLVVEVKSRHRTEKPVEWESAVLLRTAASAMQDALSKDEMQTVVQPLLIVVAREIASSLTQFSQVERFPFRVIEDEAVIDQIFEEKDSEALRTMAEQYLGVATVGPPVIDDPV